jgi:hypothetical protein
MDGRGEMAVNGHLSIQLVWGSTGCRIGGLLLRLLLTLRGYPAGIC